MIVPFHKYMPKIWYIEFLGFTFGRQDGMWYIYKGMGNLPSQSYDEFYCKYIWDASTNTWREKINR